MKEYDISEIAEKLFLWVGASFLFLGFSGLIIIIMYPTIFGEDDALQFAIAFSNSYMFILGIFLVLYRTKIIVKGYRT